MWQTTARLVFTWGAVVALAAFTGQSAKQAFAQTEPAKPTGVRATPAKADASKPGPGLQKPAAPASAPAVPVVGPVLTMETDKGTIVFQLYQKDAPKSVAHIVELVKSSFYRSQRIIRVVPGQLVQFGDKQSRDFTRREWWGRGMESGSGHPIGVAEFSKTRTFKLGTVGLAHPGDPAQSDSQMFFALNTIPQWTGKYVIIGQVTSGLEVLPKLKVEDAIKNITIAGGT
jgi:cyclophilin family peptidyl-prolyl cis-trans isomerase